MESYWFVNCTYMQYGNIQFSSFYLKDEEYNYFRYNHHAKTIGQMLSSIAPKDCWPSGIVIINYQKATKEEYDDFKH